MTRVAALAERLEERLESLSRISEDSRGVTRRGFSATEREAHELVAGWAGEASASVEVDPAGNTIMTYRPGEPYFLLGSHLDSVPAGGRFDGAAGVVAALETAGRMRQELELGLRVVAFTCEEGAAFGRPCLGSELATGQIDVGALGDLRNPDGQSALECAAAVGLSPRDCPAWLKTPDVAAFLELHIEQGLVLESDNVPIGVVDTIAGTGRIDFRCRGRAGHTGTTPMELRADALAGAAEIVLAVERTAREEHTGVATLGRLEIDPNVVTTIPSEVRGVIDIRDYTDPLRQEAMMEAIERATDAIASERGLEINLRLLSWREPIVLSAWPRRALKAACADLEIPFRIMPSGAGHDAAVTASTTPTGLVFVPTPGGQSHVPEEACRAEDLARGVEVLCHALSRLDAEARGKDPDAG